MSSLKKATPICECDEYTVCKPCDEKARMKLKGRDYDVDPGSHVGPPAEKAPRCGEKIKTMRWDLVFACSEPEGHRGSHYAVSDDGKRDLAWNGPDELRKGDYTR